MQSFGIHINTLPQSEKIILESHLLIWVDLGALVVLFWYPFEALSVSFCNTLAPLLDSPGYLGISLRTFLHLFEQTHLPTE